MLISIQSSPVIWSKSVPISICYGRFVSEKQLYFWEGDLLPENFVEIVPFILHAFFLHLSFTNTVTFVVERSIATFNLMHYEKDTRCFTVFALIVCQWLFSAATIAFFSAGKEYHLIMRINEF
jgi:hypothetical protein